MMKKRILLVDDNDLIRANLASLIQSVGFEVIEAVDGLDGLTRAKQYKVDAFVIDYKMPVINGVNLIKNLRDMPEYENHKMVLLTTENNAEFKSAIKGVEIAEVMSKPVDALRFTEVLAAFFELEAA